MILWSEESHFFSVDKNILSTINMFWYVFLSIWHHIVRFFASDYIVFTRWPGLFFKKSTKNGDNFFHQESVHHFSNKMSFHKTKIWYWKVDLNHVFLNGFRCLIRVYVNATSGPYLGKPKCSTACWVDLDERILLMDENPASQLDTCM